MNDFELPPEILNRAQQIRNDRPHTHLMYAEDVVQGARLMVDKPCDTPFAGLLPHDEHNHGVEEFIVDEVRAAGDMLSIRAVAEDGTQRGIGVHRLMLLRVADEIPEA